MAVAFDAASESHTGTTGSASQASYTWNHGGGASARAAVVFVVTVAGSPVDTGVTYDGATMSAVPYTGFDTDTEPGGVRAYFLDNCGTGTKAVVVSRTNNATVSYAVCITVTASTITEVYNAGVVTVGGSTSNTGASSSGTGTSSVTTHAVSDGNALTNSLRLLGYYSGGANVLTAGAGTTAGPSIDFGQYVAGAFYETTAGTGTRNLVTSGTGDDFGSVALAVREMVQGITLGLLDGGPALYAPTVANTQIISLPLLDNWVGDTQVEGDSFSGIGNLDGTSGEVGGPWVDMNLGAIAYENSVFQGSPLSGAEGSYAAAQSTSNYGDVYVDADMESVPGTTGFMSAIFVRGDGATDGITGDWYAVKRYQGGGSTSLIRVTGGGETVISSFGSSDRWVRLQASGVSPTSLKVESRTTQGGLGAGWNELETTDNTAGNQRASGRVGLYTYWDFNTWAEYGPKLDSFRAYTMGAGAGLYAPTLAQTGGVSTQSVTLGLLDGSAALYAPTVVPKNTLTVPLLDGSAALYAPTVAAKNTLTVPFLDAGAALYGPTVAPAPYPISLGLLDAGAALYAPSLSAKNTLTVPLLDGSAALYEPTLSLAPYPISLGLLDAGAALYAPTVANVGGATQTIVLGLLDGGAALYAPTVAPAPYPVTLGLLDSGSALYAPTVMPDQFVTVPLLDGGSALYAPTLLAKSTITLGLLDSGSALYAPDVIPDQFVTLGLLDGGPALYAPTVTGTSSTQDVALGLLDAGNALYAVTLTTQNTITLTLLDGAAALYAPTVTPKNSVSLGLLDAGNALYAPDVIPDQFVTLPVIDAGAALYAPTVSTVNGIVVGLLDAGRALYAVTVTPTNAVILELLDSGAALYAPTLVRLGAQDVSLGVLDAGRALYEPTVIQCVPYLGDALAEREPRMRYPWYGRGLRARG